MKTKIKGKKTRLASNGKRLAPTNGKLSPTDGRLGASHSRRAIPKKLQKEIAKLKDLGLTYKEMMDITGYSEGTCYRYATIPPRKQKVNGANVT